MCKKHFEEFFKFYLGEKGSSIYIFGGQNAYLPNDIVDNVSYLKMSKDGNFLNSHLSFTSMPQPRKDHCSVGYASNASNFAFIIGGQTTGSNMVNKSLLFNLKSSTFVLVFFLRLSRLNPTCSIVGNKIVIAGGWTPISGSSNSFL